MLVSAVELYTDGSCLRNPGMGGLAYIIRYSVDDQNDQGSFPMNAPVQFKEIEVSQGFRYTTNNRMEIMAGIYGIKAVIDNVKSGVIKGATQLNLFSDSEYLVKAINMQWINKWMDNNWMTSAFQGRQPQPVKNKDLWEQVIAVQNDLKAMNINLTMTHVDGHAGHEFNERADKLAVAAATGTNHIIDEVFEQTSGLMNQNR